MSDRSTSMPRIAIRAGVIAAAAFAPVADPAASSSSIDRLASSQTYSTKSGMCEFEKGGNSVAEKSIQFPVEESWSDEKHKPELQKLIVKKATSKNVLSNEDANRLAVLQRMRREALPLATSYETFIRERDRLWELERLTEELLEYERKYGCVSNGKES